MNALVIDTHPVMQSGIKREIQRHVFNARILVAGQILEGLELMMKHQFDLIIIDISAAGGGLKVIGQIKQAIPVAKVLVYSDLDESTYALPAISSGAHGFISKQSSREELKIAIETVLKSRIYVSERLRELVLSQVMYRQNLSTKTPSQTLTPREQVVMGLLLDGKSISEIAETLKIKQSTVSSFKVNVLRKMQVSTLVALSQKVSCLNQAFRQDVISRE